ncbi:hypothetical protein BofuT4_P052590.1 [Botrytis cinerea T4]|uniref:Uncharacterized protein n=2 Tax=Botryotinia fuckeliana TaxID=40559 RepID=G2XWP0_BOTF4|nr:hypothetical protein BofuT4_P052590.1 [Botrytis cinerea T4]
MARACTEINWRYLGDSIPAFLTLAIMPFTYSIAYGLITGIVTYTLLNTSAWVLAKMSGGRIMPHDYELKDYWTYKVRGGLLPGWVRRATRGKRDFWREWDFDAEVGDKVESVRGHKTRGSVAKSHKSSKSHDAHGRQKEVGGMPSVNMNGHGERTWEMPEMAFPKSVAAGIGEAIGGEQRRESMRTMSSAGRSLGRRS